MGRADSTEAPMLAERDKQIGGNWEETGRKGVSRGAPRWDAMGNGDGRWWARQAGRQTGVRSGHTWVEWCLKEVILARRPKDGIRAGVIQVEREKEREGVRVR